MMSPPQARASEVGQVLAIRLANGRRNRKPVPHVIRDPKSLGQVSLVKSYLLDLVKIYFLNAACKQLTVAHGAHPTDSMPTKVG
jgi:hypothetical protein